MHDVQVTRIRLQNDRALEEYWPLKFQRWYNPIYDDIRPGYRFVNMYTERLLDPTIPDPDGVWVPLSYWS